MLENKKEPITPEYVFLGLIFVNLCPLNNFPNAKPPISEDIHPNIKVKRNFGGI